MSTDESIHDLLPLYALGALDEADRVRVETYLEANPHARAKILEYEAAADELGHAAEPVTPPARIKRAVLSRVRRDAGARRPSMPVREKPSFFSARGRFPAAFAWMPTALSIAALLVALAAGLWGLTLRAEVAALQTQNAALARELENQREVLAQINVPGVRVLAIQGTEARPGATGRLIAAPDEREAVLIVRGLAVLDPDHTYQVWLIDDQSPKPAGFLSIDEAGSGVVVLTAAIPLESFQAVGVSIEPQGGSQAPTGEIVLLGEITY